MEATGISTAQGNRIRQKGSWFCGTTHSPTDIERIKKNITEFLFYAYIFHDKDDGKGLHIHFIINCSGSRSIKSIGETLDCDVQDIQIARRPRSCIRYLIHADDKEKYQYNREDIITNNTDRVDFYFNSLSNSITDIYEDMKNVKTGRISATDFIQKYKSEFASLPFYQKIKTLEVIDKMSYK